MLPTGATAMLLVLIVFTPYEIKTEVFFISIFKHHVCPINQYPAVLEYFKVETHHAPFPPPPLTIFSDENNMAAKLTRLTMLPPQAKHPLTLHVQMRYQHKVHIKMAFHW